MRTIELEEVQEFLKKERSNIVIINVLSSSSFQKEHIPNSINIPLDSTDFIKQVEQHTVNRNTPIIVYCSGSECPKSKNAAEQLEKAGFTNVMHFSGGMEDWKEAEG